MNRWILTACGFLYTAIAAVYLSMAAGAVSFGSWHRAIIVAGEIEIAAGACAIFAALSRRVPGGRLALAINGSALVAMGVVQYGFTRRPIGLVVFAAFALAVAASLALYDVGAARRSRAMVVAVACASIACALPLFALAFHWIPSGPASNASIAWLGCVFAFGAAGLLMTAVPAREAAA